MSQVQTNTYSAGASVWPASSSDSRATPVPNSAASPAVTSAPDPAHSSGMTNPPSNLWGSVSGDSRSLWNTTPATDAQAAFGWPGSPLAESIKTPVASEPASDPSPPDSAGGPWEPASGGPPSVWGSSTPASEAASSGAVPGPAGDASTNILGWSGFSLPPLGQGTAVSESGVWPVPGPSDPWSGAEPPTSSAASSAPGSTWVDSSPPDSAGPRATEAWPASSESNTSESTTFGAAWGGKQAQSWPSEEQEASSGESFAKVASKGVPITNTANLPSNKSREEVERELAIQKLINSNEGWGTRPINQDTPWNVEDSPQTKRRKEMLKKAETGVVWNQEDNKTGTKIWADGGSGSSVAGDSAGPPAAPTPNWNQMRPPSTARVRTGLGAAASGMSSTWRGGPSSSWDWQQKSARSADWRGGSVSSYDSLNEPPMASGGQAFSRSVSWHPGARDVFSEKPSWEDDGKIGTWGGARPVTSGSLHQDQQWNGASRRPDDRLWDSDNMHWNPQTRKEPQYQQNDNDMGHWGGSAEGSVQGDFRPDNGTRFWMRSDSTPASVQAPQAAARQSSYMGGSSQMRSKMIQQLVEMGFKKEEAQESLINNNMDFDRTLAELKSAGGLRSVLGLNTSVAPPLSKLSGLPPGGLPPGALLQKSNRPPPPLPAAGGVQQQQLLQQQQQLVQQLRAAVQKGLIGSQVLQQPLSPTLLTSVANLLQIVQNIQKLQGSVQVLQSNLNSPVVSSAQRQLLVQQIQEQQLRLQAMQRQFTQLTQYINSGRAANMTGPPLSSPSMATGSIDPQQGWPQFQDLRISGDGGKAQSKLSDWTTKEGGEGLDFTGAAGAGPAAAADLGVAEFVPGKPWSGLNLQRSADDDEHMTPGMAQQASKFSVAPPGGYMEQLSRDKPHGTWQGGLSVDAGARQPYQPRSMRGPPDTAYPPPPVGYLGGADNF